jgi:hypothetical protein
LTTPQALADLVELSRLEMRTALEAVTLQLTPVRLVVWKALFTSTT